MIEVCWRPAGARVASGAILNKLTGMGIVLFVAGPAVLGSGGEVCERQGMVVALVARHTRMFSCQRESKCGMIEGITETVNTVVAAKTFGSIGCEMALHEGDIDLSVTTHAGGGIKRLDINGVTILTDKCCTIDVLCVPL